MEKKRRKDLLERNLDKCDGYLDRGEVCSLDTLRKYQTKFENCFSILSPQSIFAEQNGIAGLFRRFGPRTRWAPC